MKRFLLCMLVPLVLSGCFKKKEIAFDSSDPLALLPDVQWAVVVQPYVAFRAEPGFEKQVQDHGRRGDIMQVQGKRLVKTESGPSGKITAWYEFEQGWLEDTVVSIYDNKLKAQTAASKLH
ncbi:MAG: hypothetical protein J1D88_05705 [Treponema sp.]|nr:hypothetical protein [Treponema sp.]